MHAPLFPFHCFHHLHSVALPSVTLPSTCPVTSLCPACPTGDYPADAVILGSSEASTTARAAFTELYSGLKRDSLFDPTNGYKPRKPVKLD